MMEDRSSIDAYFNKQSFAKEGLLVLRKLLLSLGLEESLKWGSPVYTYEGKNLVGLNAFKSYFGLWYFQGALLKDDHAILLNAQEGKTKALRQIRFKDISQIDLSIIKSYTLEAIQNQKLGKEIKATRSKKITVPLELKKKLKGNQALNHSYEKLSKGKQREYCDYISEAKRESTRNSRLEKCIPMIMNGVGLNDRYKK